MSLYDDYFRTLPREILIDTLYDTGIGELLSLCSTDIHMRDICDDDGFWKKYVIRNFRPSRIMTKSWQEDFIDFDEFTWKNIAKTYRYGKPFIIIDMNNFYHLVPINQRMTLEDVVNLISKYDKSGESKYTLEIVNPITNTIEDVWLHRVNDQIMRETFYGDGSIDSHVDIITPIGESHLYDLLVYSYTAYVA
jgi:hypothetical protein